MVILSSADDYVGLLINGQCLLAHSQQNFQLTLLRASAEPPCEALRYTPGKETSQTQVRTRMKGTRESRAIKCSNSQPPVYFISELAFLFTPYETGNNNKGGDKGGNKA